MNIFILNTMNHYNLTEEQSNLNSNAANNFSAANALNYGNYVNHIAYCAASSVAAYHANPCSDAEHWLNEYFKETGESRPEYEAELERDNSFREVF
jgi:hypothetical protein